MLPVLASLIAVLALAPAAQATFHEIKVREVFPSSGDGSYVNLQMYNAGQNLVSTHSLTVYNASGTSVHTSTFSSNVANSANQSLLLIGDTNVQTEQGVAPDLVDSGLSLSAAGGAVCWNAGGVPSDCVSWGNFTGNAMLPSPGAGTPVSGGGITAGKAIRRSIAPGCATLLEVGDDTNNSSTDFAEVDPAPRNNATTPTEGPCAAAPNTTIDSSPPAQTNSTTATFTYHSTPTGATFECNLDEGGFGACPASYTSLTEGQHDFEVRAVSGGMTDPSPAAYSWKVDLTPPVTTIDTKPEDPSSGVSPKFTFHSDPGSTFQCSLVKKNEPDSFVNCSSPKTFATIAVNGEYTFKVKAKDPATNQGAAVEYTWEVDTSLGDKTPPETTITAKPSDPSSSTTANFSYESNEPNSTFECKLDAESFAACPAGGKTYTGLAAGMHTFQVVAIDASNNKDASPAGYTFNIALTPPPEEKPPVEEKPPTEERHDAPDTKITTKPPAKTHDRTPTIKFKATISPATFECKIDSKGYKPCRSPLTTKSLSPGRHTVKVRAVAGGVKDSTPATVSFKVVKG